MKSQRLAISFSEFERMPQPFGWKVEYYDDEAHLTPREYAIRTKLVIQPRVIETWDLLQPIDAGYQAQMIKAFYQAFRDSVEFCDWTTKKIYKHADKSITDYFAQVRGQVLPCSVMAIEAKTQQVIGLALFLINRKQRYELDLLLVNPRYRRQGLATAMLSTVTHQLAETGVGELYSTYHICNELSRQWHQKMGFQEEYDGSFVRLKYAWYREEIRRQELLGLTQALPELIRERDDWHRKLQDEDLQQYAWLDED